MVFFGALRVKIRDEGLVKNEAVYVALALNPIPLGIRQFAPLLHSWDDRLAYCTSWNSI